jgi:acetyl esterase
MGEMVDEEEEHNRASDPHRPRGDRRTRKLSILVPDLAGSIILQRQAERKENVDDEDPEKPKPAIVFFFGGGWVGGSPTQFERQARHLAERGMIAMVADYRVKSRNKTSAVACVEDGKAAVAWIRTHAKRLGVDPNRIAAAGGSAGGHVAATTGTLSGFGSDERPNAMILFNPGLTFAELDGWKPKGFGVNANAEAVKKRLGVEKATELSPSHHVGAHTPPTLILHGEKDTTVPLASAQVFEAQMKKAKRPCKLVIYEGASHGFFNRGDAFDQTLKEADQFLVELGWLEKV